MAGEISELATLFRQILEQQAEATTVQKKLSDSLDNLKHVPLANQEMLRQHLGSCEECPATVREIKAMTVDIATGIKTLVTSIQKLTAREPRNRAWVQGVIIPLFGMLISAYVAFTVAKLQVLPVTTNVQAQASQLKQNEEAVSENYKAISDTQKEIANLLRELRKK